MLTSLVSLQATSRLRWMGGLLLLAALAMLIAGETLLKQRLEGVVFLLYWLLCFLFTGAAMIVACLVARAVRHKSRNEARELIEKTLGKIQSDVQQSPRRADDGKP